MNYCAPGRYGNPCPGADAIRVLVDAYNRYLVKNRLRHPGEQPIPIGSPEDTFRELLHRIQCSHELCLFDSPFYQGLTPLEKKLVQESYRPIGPEDPQAWLSTTDIENIMRQYEKEYPDFIFLGAVPSNCDELDFCPLYNIKFAKYRGKRLGIIFNTDEYGNPGSHWVALYIHVDRGDIYFFDPVGKKPLSKIERVINNYLHYYRQMTGQNAHYHYNQKKIQQDSSECGVYCCNFLIRLLAGESYQEIIQNPLTFEEINACRNVYFRNHPAPGRPGPKCDPKHVLGRQHGNGSKRVLKNHRFVSKHYTA